MRILDSHYLDDGRLYNDGRPAKLIQIEDPADYDQLLRNILDSGYYSEDYFQRNLHHQGGQLKYENLGLAEIAHLLNPGKLLELGCGRGDVLWLLSLAGREDLLGLDISRDAAQSAPPELQGKIMVGGLWESCRQLAAQGRRFDAITGFDIWEHLHPAQLNDHLAALRAIATEDALLFFIIPAFGEDRIFGELHPLEVEENRAAFQERRPFEYLMAESLDPVIPANGHLIWAHSEWWENQFKSHGWQRDEDLEKGLHRLFDPYLWRAQRSFFVMRQDNQAAKDRVARLRQYHLDLLYLWRTKLHFFRVLENRRADTGQAAIDPKRLTDGLDDAGVRLHDFHQAQSAALWGRVRELESEDQRLREGIDYLRQLLFPLVWLRKLVARCTPQGLKRRLQKPGGQA